MSMTFELLAIPAAQARDLAADSSGVQNLLNSAAGSADLLSLQKSWHGLHYVLTGSAEEGAPPLNFLMAGGEPLVEEDAGYGPARLLANEELRTVDAALDAFTEADFDRNFDLGEMAANQIYPFIWDEPLDNLKREYGGYLAKLKELVKRATKAGHSLIMVMH